MLLQKVYMVWFGRVLVYRYTPVVDRYVPAILSFWVFSTFLFFLLCICVCLYSVCPSVSSVFTLFMDRVVWNKRFDLIIASWLMVSYTVWEEGSADLTRQAGGPYVPAAQQLRRWRRRHRRRWRVDAQAPATSAIQKRERQDRDTTTPIAAERLPKDRRRECGRRCA